MPYIKNNNKNSSLSGIHISPVKEYNTPYADNVPMGHYKSIIDEIERMDNHGKSFIAKYTLRDKSGMYYYIQMKYYEGSYSWNEFMKKMVDYGFPEEDTDLFDMVGLKEDVFLAYDETKNYRFGFFTKREIAELPPGFEYVDDEEEIAEEEEGE